MTPSILDILEEIGKNIQTVKITNGWITKFSEKGKNDEQPYTWTLTAEYTSTDNKILLSNQLDGITVHNDKILSVMQLINEINNNCDRKIGYFTIGLNETQIYFIIKAVLCNTAISSDTIMSWILYSNSLISKYYPILKETAIDY